MRKAKRNPPSFLGSSFLSPPLEVDLLSETDVLLAWTAGSFLACNNKEDVESSLAWKNKHKGPAVIDHSFA